MPCITTAANTVLEGLYNFDTKIKDRRHCYLYNMDDSLYRNSKKTNEKLLELIGELKKEGVST